MPSKRQSANRSAQRLGERERAVGLEPDDDAARWLSEQAPSPSPELSKSATKSRVLHQWRQRQLREQKRRGT